MNQKNRRHCVENGLLRFFTIQNQRVKDEEISVEMIRNYKNCKIILPNDWSGIQLEDTIKRDPSRKPMLK